VDVRVYIAPEFSDSERSNIIEGILMWERATSGLIVWHLLPYESLSTNPPHPADGSNENERAVLFRRAVSSDEWVLAWSAEHGHKKNLMGLCQGDSSTELAWLWLVENRLPTTVAEVVIASHEFGHALGLDHIDDKSSVMSEYYNNTVRCLSQHDLAEFCKKYGCDPTVLHETCMK